MRSAKIRKAIPTRLQSSDGRVRAFGLVVILDDGGNGEARFARHFAV